MLEPARFSDRYRVRRMGEGDADALLSFCLQNTQYYAYCGRRPSRELILNDLRLTPPGVEASAKYYVGFYDGDELAAILDLIEGYPEEDACFIGFFMMNRALQGRQIGTAIIEALCRYLRETGCARVLLGIDRDNPQSTHFWKKNGFRVIREIEQDGGVILLAEKSL